MPSFMWVFMPPEYEDLIQLLVEPDYEERSKHKQMQVSHLDLDGVAAGHKDPFQRWGMRPSNRK